MKVELKIEHQIQNVLLYDSCTQSSMNWTKPNHHVLQHDLRMIQRVPCALIEAGYSDHLFKGFHMINAISDFWTPLYISVPCLKKKKLIILCSLLMPC